MSSYKANSKTSHVCPRTSWRLAFLVVSLVVLSVAAATPRCPGASTDEIFRQSRNAFVRSSGAAVHLAAVYAQSIESGLFEKGKVNLLLALAFIALETTLVGLLLVQIRRTNRARRMVERRFAMERVILECSDRLADCPSEKVEGEMRRALEAVRAAKDVDWALWCTVELATGKVRRSLAVGVANQGNRPGFQLGENTPWLIAQLSKLPEVALCELQDMPAEAATDRLYFEQHHIGSLLALGFGTEGKRLRILALAGCEESRGWTPALIARLRTIGNLFGNALSRRRAEEELRDNQQWLEMALEAATAALWELDVQSGKVRWSQKDNSLIGKGPVELELPWEKFLERVPEEDRKDLYTRAVALLENRDGSDNIVTEWRYHEPDGSERWLLFRGQVYRDDEGKPKRLRGVNVDITVLKQAKSELLELTERLIRAQEEERQRLSRELHDDIGQRLSLLVITLDRLQQELPRELWFLREELAATLDEANQLATDIHGLSHQLHSTKLKHLGLAAALGELCSQVSRQHGIDVKLQVEAIAGELGEERALCLYRVAQEALQNAAKHSGSTAVQVEVLSTGNILRMRVKDNGCGFDVNHYQAGAGLASMRERLRMASGKLQVSSRAGEGTEILTEMALEPLAKHASAD